MKTAWAIALSVLFSSVAGAQEATPPPVDPAGAIAEAGRAEIAAGAYETGIAKLLEASKLSASTDLLLEIAIAYSQWQGHCQDSITYFDRFFAACQGCAAFSTARDRNNRVRAACMVKIRVESTPPGAMISIDGAALGASPLEISVVAGAHGFEAELSGYSGPASSHSFLPGQQDAVVKLQLEPLPAFIEFRNVMPESTVTISGVPAKPPKMEVQPGRHKIEASKPGYDSKTIEVVARRGETTQVDVALQPTQVTYRTYMWASVGIGAFALLSTGAFGLMLREVKADRDRELMRSNPEESLIMDFDNRIASRTRLIAITGGIAGAGAIAALIFYLIEPEGDQTVALGMGPEGVVVGGRF